MAFLVDEIKLQLSLWEEEYQRPFWEVDDLLVVAVSGGPDSLALLHLLARQGLHDSENIVVAHLDHMLRDSSADDAEFVATLCSKWDLPCVVRAVNVAAHAQEHGLSLEEAARVLRYRFLSEVAVEHGSHYVVVGHNANDQAETVMMNVVRGAGLRGLRGMQPLSQVPGNAQLYLLRPLLNATREAIRAHCVAHELQPRVDPSNRDEGFFRNRVRHELVPLLEQYNPQVQETLRQMATVARADLAYLDLQTEAALKALMRHSPPETVRMNLLLWRQLPLNIRRRTLRRALLQLRGATSEVGFVTIEQARQIAERGNVGARASLPGGMVLEVEYETILLHDGETEQLPALPQITAENAVRLSVPGSVGLHNGWILRAEFVENKGDQLYVPDPWLEYVDADHAGNLVIRPRREGERIQPLGMQGQSTKLKEVMIDTKIPAALRSHWPIVANEDHVVWIVGIALDDRVRIHENTRRVIQLRCERISG